MNANLHDALAKAVVTLLTPLVRILLRNGVSYGTFAELAKKVFVDVADVEFQEPGKKQTVSRISALTGLTRKEAKRLRELVAVGEGESQARYSRATRVIGGWLNDARYQDGRGKPRVIPLDGDPPSFAALVKSYSGDIPTQAMFRVLAEAEVIERRDDGIHLLRHAYIPGKDPVDKLHILGTDAGELIATIDHNLTAPPGGLRFQRKVSNAQVDPAALPEFQRLSAERAQALLEELDAWLAEHEVDAAGASDADKASYVSMGIYYFEGPRREEDES